MTSAVVRTPKLTDGQIYKFIQSLLEIFPDGKAKISYPASQSGGIDKTTKISKEMLSSKERLVQEFEFSFPGTIDDSVVFHRGVVSADQWVQSPNRNGFVKPLPNAYFDELGLLEPQRQPHYGNPPPTPRDRLEREQVFSITTLINALAAEATFVGESESASTLSDILAGQVGDLRNLHLEMTRGLAEAQKDAEKQYANRRTQLESEIAARHSALQEEERALEKRRQELNDREPQHERRRLREHLT